MRQADVFTLLFRRNQDAILRATDGLIHSDSLLQLPGNSNCLNWVLGHVAVYRDAMLAGICQPGLVGASERKLYNYGSKRIVAGSEAVRLERLLEVLDDGFEALSGWLESNPTRLEDSTPLDLEIRRGATVTEHFAVLCWHESNHIGELHALRELALLQA